jgi:hypothetical protein
MIRPGSSVNSPAITSAPRENQDHDAAMIRDLMPMRLPHAERNGNEREDRQAGTGIAGAALSSGARLTAQIPHFKRRSFNV